MSLTFLGINLRMDRIHIDDEIVDRMISSQHADFSDFNVFLGASKEGCILTRIEFVSAIFGA